MLQLDTLIIAAENYVLSGRRLSDLNPVEAQRLGFVPRFWISSAPIPSRLGLKGLNNGDIVVAIIGSPEVIRSFADKYQSYAKVFEVSLLAPVVAFGHSEPSMLLLEYDPTQLARAAAMVRQREAAEARPALPPQPKSANGRDRD